MNEPNNEDGYISYIFIGIIYVTYIICALWARFRGRIKDQFYFLEKQDAAHYRYTITIYTGNGLTDGTTNNVRVKLIGSKHKSPPHYLQTSNGIHVFTRDNVNSFLLCTNQHLGDINKIKFIRDGKKAGERWGFRRMLIRDLERDECWFFSGDVSFGDQQSNLVLPALTRDEVKRHGFCRRLEIMFKDRHLLFGVSPLTNWHHRVMNRLERISVFYLSVFMLMLTTFAIFSYLKSPGSLLGPVSVWKLFVIGVASPCFVVPITHCVSELFRLARRRGESIDPMNETRNVCDDASISDQSETDHDQLRRPSRVSQISRASRKSIVSTTSQICGRRASRVGRRESVYSTITAPESRISDAQSNDTVIEPSPGLHVPGQPSGYEMVEPSSETPVIGPSSGLPVVGPLSGCPVTVPPVVKPSCGLQEIRLRSGPSMIETMSEPPDEDGDAESDDISEQVTEDTEAEVIGLRSGASMIGTMSGPPDEDGDAESDDNSEQVTADTEAAHLLQLETNHEQHISEQLSGLHDQVPPPDKPQLSPDSGGHASGQMFEIDTPRDSFSFQFNEGVSGPQENKLVLNAGEKDAPQQPIEEERRPASVEKRLSWKPVKVGEAWSSSPTAPVAAVTPAVRRFSRSNTVAPTPEHEEVLNTQTIITVNEKKAKTPKRNNAGIAYDPNSDKFKPLPRCFRLIAWFFVIITAVTSSAVCLYHVTSYDLKPTLQWWLCVLVAVVVMVIFTQPILVVILTLISLRKNPSVRISEWLPPVPSEVAHGGQTNVIMSTEYEQYIEEED